MNKKLVLLAILFTVFCLLSASNIYAMGSAPPPPTQEVEIVPTASEEALAKEQIDNLKNISINSETIDEGMGKFVSDLYSGKRYLYEFNDVAKKELLKIALNKSENWKYRWAAMGFMSPDNPPEAFEVFKKVYRDKSEMINLRRQAIRCISGTNRETKKQETVTLLIEALRDKDLDLVASAANALGTKKAKPAVDDLIQTLKHYSDVVDSQVKSGKIRIDRVSIDEDVVVRCSIRALGEIGDPKAVPSLVKSLENPNLGELSNGAVVDALGKIGDKGAVDALIKVIETKDGPVGSAIEALGNIGDKRAIDPLEKMLKQGLYKEETAKALRKIAGKEY